MSQASPAPRAPLVQVSNGPVEAPVGSGGALTTRELRIVDALAEVVIPVGRRFGLTPREAQLGARLDAFLSSGKRRFARGYKALLWMLEVSTLLPGLGMRFFSRLDEEQRAHAVEAWHDSPAFLLRAAFRGLTTLLYIIFYGHQRVHDALGYRAPKPQSDAPRAPPANARNVQRKDADVTLDVDAVVVGSGAGGAAAAFGLAKQGASVVILEEGPFVARGEFTGHALDMTRLMYRDDGVTLALGVPGILLPIGRVAGGTTTINSGTCFRTPDAVLQQWQYTRGLLGLSPSEMAPYFDQVEHVLGVTPVPEALYGRGGEVVARGARAMGWKPFPLPRNAPDCAGAGNCCFGCPTGAKRSANESWLPMATQAGAQLLCNVAVDRVMWNGRRAVGVEARANHDGPRVTVRARNVILAAGTLHTPALLRRSGVRGPALGRHLTLHPATKCMALFDEQIRGWEGVPQQLGVEAPTLDGIKFEGAFVPPSVGAVALPFVGERHTQVMEQYDHLATYGMMVKDNANGFLRFRGREAIPFYTPGEFELQRFRQGVRMLTQLFLAAGAHTVLTPLHAFPQVRNARDLAELQRFEFGAADVELSAFHPLGTARMAATPEDGMCDENGTVFGREGLHIADGSAVPSSLGVNPQVTIMALALRLAQRLTQETR